MKCSECGSTNIDTQPFEAATLEYPGCVAEATCCECGADCTDQYNEAIQDAQAEAEIGEYEARMGDPW